MPPDAIVPAMVNGKPQIPYIGVGKYQPRGRKAAPPIRSNKDYPENGDKRVPDLETALRKCGLRDGMVISSHHHLRDGDRVALMALTSRGAIGVKDLLWFPSASFPRTRAPFELMENGRHPSHRRHDERSARRLLHARKNARHGRASLPWRTLAGDSGWRSTHRHRRHCRAHGRSFGNADGSHGKSACGSLGFALADSMYADQRHRRHRQPGAVPLHSLADSGQQRRLRCRSRFHRRPRKNRLRHHADHPLARSPAHRRTCRQFPARSGNHAKWIFLPGRRRRHRTGLCSIPESA